MWLSGAIAGTRPLLSASISAYLPTYLPYLLTYLLTYLLSKRLFDCLQFVCSSLHTSLNLSNPVFW